MEGADLDYAPVHVLNQWLSNAGVPAAAPKLYGPLYDVTDAFGEDEQPVNDLLPNGGTGTMFGAIVSTHLTDRGESRRSDVLAAQLGDTDAMVSWAQPMAMLPAAHMGDLKQCAPTLFALGAIGHAALQEGADMGEHMRSFFDRSFELGARRRSAAFLREEPLRLAHAALAAAVVGTRDAGGDAHHCVVLLARDAGLWLIDARLLRPHRLCDFAHDGGAAAFVDATRRLLDDYRGREAAGAQRVLFMHGERRAAA